MDMDGLLMSPEQQACHRDGAVTGEFRWLLVACVDLDQGARRRKYQNTSVRAQCAKMKSTRIMAEKATAIISASAAMARPRLRRGLPPTPSIEASFDKGFPRSRRKAWKGVCIAL